MATFLDEAVVVGSSSAVVASGSIVVVSSDEFKAEVTTPVVGIFAEAGIADGEEVSEGGATVVDVSNGIGTLAARLPP